MKMRVVEEIARCVGDRFMEQYCVRAVLLGEKTVDLQILNTTELIETDEEGVLTWKSFLLEWKTTSSTINMLDQLWNRPLGENLIWFYNENFREIAAHLMNYLVDYCSGAIKVTVTPEYMYISFQKVEGQ